MPNFDAICKPKFLRERRVGVHSFQEQGAQMRAHSFHFQRVRAERNSKNMGALNTLQMVSTLTG